MGHQFLDCKGLACPMPLVALAKALKDMEAGETLMIEATDTAFGADLRAWARMTGNTLVEFEEGDVQKAVIRKA